MTDGRVRLRSVRVRGRSHRRAKPIPRCDRPRQRSHAGTVGKVRWGDPDAADESGTLIGFSTLPTSGDVDGEVVAVQLEYIAARGEESTEYAYRVPITYTACNFGDERPWFRCPAEGCVERVGKLYLPPRRARFACRECYGLAY